MFNYSSSFLLFLNFEKSQVKEAKDTGVPKELCSDWDARAAPGEWWAGRSSSKRCREDNSEFSLIFTGCVYPSSRSFSWAGSKTPVKRVGETSQDFASSLPSPAPFPSCSF